MMDPLPLHALTLEVTDVARQHSCSVHSAASAMTSTALRCTARRCGPAATLRATQTVSEMLADPSAAPVPTGSAGLDASLGGGLLRTWLVEVTGGPSAGKTSLVTSWCAVAASQERSVRLVATAPRHVIVQDLRHTLLPMLRGLGKVDALRNVDVAPWTTRDLQDLVEAVQHRQGPFAVGAFVPSLLVIDSLSAVVAATAFTTGTEREAALLGLMRSLKQYAQETSTCVVIVTSSNADGTPHAIDASVVPNDQQEATSSIVAVAQQQSGHHGTAFHHFVNQRVLCHRDDCAFRIHLLKSPCSSAAAFVFQLHSRTTPVDSTGTEECLLLRTSMEKLSDFESRARRAVLRAGEAYGVLQPFVNDVSLQLPFVVQPTPRV